MPRWACDCARARRGDAGLDRQPQPGGCRLSRQPLSSAAAASRPARARSHASCPCGHGRFRRTCGRSCKILRLTGMTAEIVTAGVPLSKAARANLCVSAPSHLETILTGGDDYELICAVPPFQGRRVRSRSGSCGDTGAPASARPSRAARRRFQGPGRAEIGLRAAFLPAFLTVRLPKDRR